MINVKLTFLTLGFATIVASLQPLPAPVILEAAVHPELPSMASYVDIPVSERTEPTGTAKRGLVSTGSEPVLGMGATEVFASSATSDFVGAVRDAATAITAVAGEEGGEAASQWHCTGWDRILIWHCWWYCTRPNYFCPCVTCEF